MNHFYSFFLQLRIITLCDEIKQIVNLMSKAVFSLCSLYFVIIVPKKFKIIEN